MLRRLTGLLALLLAGCEGQILLPPAPGTTVTPDPRKDDEVLRNEDEILFALATRYFPGQDLGAAPKRLSRLTRRQLDLTTQSLLPAHYTASVLPKDPLQTNYEYAAHLGFTPANFTPYRTWVEQLTTRVRANPQTVINCAPTNTACLDAEAKKFVARAFRGVVPDGQLKKLTDFFLASSAQVGFPDATADLVDLTLHSPSYVFREEVHTDAANALLPAQQLQNLTYTLANAPPEALSLSSTTPAMYLQSPEALNETVDKILATPQAREKLYGFFAAWLEIKEPDEFTLDPGAYPDFTPAVAAAAVEETRRFLNHHLAKASPKLKDVTQSTQSFVSQSLAAIYGLDPSGLSGTLVDLDPSKRLGIFTQPAVIASHSGPTTTRLVKRGVFFTRKVMCLPLGAVPGDVDTTLPPATGLTERQRIDAPTRVAKCAGCHTFINPFGFVQENYDATGKWRTTDNGQPIDASISVNFLDEGPLSTGSPVNAMKAFTSSARFKQCFVRQLFRYYVGRDERPSDDPLLRKMFFTFALKDDQDLVGLLRLLATSSHFAQRAP
jgi:hypothetical protein